MATDAGTAKEQTLEGLSMAIREQATSLLDRINTFRGQGLEPVSENKKSPPLFNAIDGIFENLHMTRNALGESEKSFASLISRIR